MLSHFILAAMLCLTFITREHNRCHFVLVDLVTIYSRLTSTPKVTQVTVFEETHVLNLLMVFYKCLVLRLEFTPCFWTLKTGLQVLCDFVVPQTSPFLENLSTVLAGIFL